MLLRRSKATTAKQGVTEQVGEKTDDLMAALETAREAISRATATAARKRAELGAELSREASRAADKLLPERAKQRRREAARKRRRRLLAGAAGLIGTGVVIGRLSGSKGGLGQSLKRQVDKAGGGWDRVAESGHDADSAEVTRLRQGNGATTTTQTPPS
jgi:hypothetical protein